MSGILIKDREKGNGINETFEKGILRKVLRESWQDGILKNATTDPKVSRMLDEHASKMESLLGSFDYSAICMPNIISNSRRMSYKELVAYLALMESLGIGYRHRFDGELANIFLAGLTLKARDTHSASRYLEGFMTAVGKRLSYYSSKGEKENKELGLLVAELDSKSSGFLRFFRKGEISALKRMVSMKRGRSTALSKRREKYSNILIKVNGPGR